MEQDRYNWLIDRIRSKSFYYGFVKHLLAISFAAPLWIVGYEGAYKNDIRSSVIGGILAAMCVEGYRKNNNAYKIHKSLSNVVNSLPSTDSSLESIIKKTDEHLKELNLTNEEIDELKEEILEGYV